ncbi:MAG TPA: Abi family protein [Caldisericia bacterium]|nr:Abi family protein [Caldisericia bacterium]
MIYDKDFKSTEELAERLISQGIQGLDNSEKLKEEIISKLKYVNYYRLKLYWHPYRKHLGGDDYEFYNGVTFEYIWNLYRFDRRLRLLVLDGIERIEVAIRTLITHLHSRDYGKWGYLNLNQNTFPFMGETINILGKRRTIPDYVTFLSKILHKVNQSEKSEDFIQHHLSKYMPDQYLPMWIVAEVMDYGMMYQAFKGLDNKLKTEIANIFSTKHSRIDWGILYTWLDSMRYVRNICAHHSRLWNRILTNRPTIPKRKHKKVDIWASCRLPNNDRVYTILCIINYLLGTIIPKSGWKKRLFSLIDDFDMVPLRNMGFPSNWKETTIWKEYL